MASKKTLDVDLSGNNPLTIEDVAALATDFALTTLEEREGRKLLLLFHAFTYESNRGTREGMLQAIKEAFAFIFPAFDTMLRNEIGAELAALRKGGEG
jgi:hypothetical protein